MAYKIDPLYAKRKWHLNTSKTWMSDEGFQIGELMSTLVIFVYVEQVADSHAHNVMHF